MKSQIPISNDQNRFGILKLGPRPQGGESKRSADNFGHCNLFVICYLEFLVTLPIEAHFDFLNVKVQHLNPSQI